MSRKDRATQLQTPAHPSGMTDDERYKAGWGGSYSVDPITGVATLVESTQDATIVPEQHPNAPKHLQEPDAAASGQPAAE